MTTIAAIQGDGWVLMGADTQSTVNDYKRLKMSGEKVYDNNGILIAGCGQGRGLNLLHHAWTAPKPPVSRDPEKLDVWMAKTFIPKMRELFIKSGYDMKDDGDYAQHDSVFLVAVNNVLYYVDDDYSFDRESRRYLASGSGGDFALGALTTLGNGIFKDIASAKKALIAAVNAAKQFDVYTGGETKTYLQQV